MNIYKTLLVNSKKKMECPRCGYLVFDNKEARKHVNYHLAYLFTDKKIGDAMKICKKCWTCNKVFKNEKGLNIHLGKKSEIRKAFKLKEKRG